MNILITCCLGDSVRSTIRSLKENEDLEPVRIVGADSSEPVFNSTGYDVFHRTPMISSDLYLSALLHICKIEHIDVLIPNHSDELSLLATFKHLFEEIGTKVLITGGKLDIANNKILWAGFFADKNVKTPFTVLVRSPAEVSSIAEAHPNSKFCIKRSDGCGSRGMYLVTEPEYNKNARSGIMYATPKMQEQAFRECGPMLMQEYIDGDEYTVDLLMDHGRVLCSATKYNKCMRDGIAMVSEIVDAPAVTSMCIEAATLLEIDGNIGFDVLVKGDDVFLIDINPRITATISLAWKAGLNILWLSVKRCLGADISHELTKAIIGTKVCRKVYDFFVCR